MANTQQNTATNTTVYTELPAKENIEKALEAFKANNFIPEFVETKEQALAKVQEIIPEGATIMNGSSITLQEIGFIDLLKSKNHRWNNLHDGILAEKDQAKQAELRKQAVNSEYYIGSVHGASETGELVIASNTGSQLAHIVNTSPNLVLVVSAKKIMPTLTDAINRLKDHVINLEDQRMQKEYGMGTTHAKTVVLHKESPMMGRKVHVIVVNEDLGF